MSGAAWAGELRTRIAATDPGLARLRLAVVAVGSMAVATGVMSGLRELAGLSATVVLFAGLLAMVVNLAVTDPDPAGQRVTAVLMLAPAVASVVAGTLLAPHPVPADVVFVLVMVGATYCRRYPPRGSALGMAVVMPYFFSQFLQARVAELPWLVAAAAVGIGSAVTLRAGVFAERPERAVARLMRAFRARLHAVVVEAAAVVAARPGPDQLDATLRGLRRARARLNDTALLVADQLDRLRAPDRPEPDAPGQARSNPDPPDCDPQHPDGPDPGRSGRLPAHWPELELRLVDAELCAERLVVTVARLLRSGGAGDPAAGDALAGALRTVARATRSGVGPAERHTELDAARAVAVGLVTGSGARDAALHPVALAAVRLSDALRPPADRDRPDPPAPGQPAPADAPIDGTVGRAGPGPTTPEAARHQAIQVGLATSVAIVLGELLSPSRWYWAVIAAFVVFAGTTSRGEILTRGLQRVVGTLGGVVAGTAVATAVGVHRELALAGIFAAAFLALYLARVSQAMLAFWITVVLGLLYGLLGQVSEQTLVLRLEETAVGASLGVLAGWWILPTGTRRTFLGALDATVTSIQAILDGSYRWIVATPSAPPPTRLAHDLHAQLAILRQRARPLDNPLPRRRGRTTYHRALRVLTVTEHYTRSLAVLSQTLREPGWAPTLGPAVDQVSRDLDTLRELMHGGAPETDPDPSKAADGPDAIDAAERYATERADPTRRAELHAAIRMLRQIDQVLAGLVADLGPPNARPRRDGGRKIR